MIKLIAPYRPATPADAIVMAELVNIAGEGLPLYIWNSMAGSEENGWDVGYARAQRESGAFSYRNAVIREDNGDIAACLIGYPLEDKPTAVNYEEMPPMFVPLQQLEDEVPGTWYVNVLAVYPEWRNRGFGSALLAIAEQLARDSNKYGLSIIVSDANHGARRLYLKQGYREVASRPMVKEGWRNSGEQWVLLTRDI